MVGAAAAAVIVTVPAFDERRISVPRPSFASTEALEKEIVAEPADFAEKSSVTTRPPVPEYPGFGTIPSSAAVPFVFENAGSCAQSVMIEGDFDTDSSVSLSVGKERFADIALSDSPLAADTVIGTEIEPPTVVDTLPTVSVAADAQSGSAKKNARETLTRAPRANDIYEEE